MKRTGTAGGSTPLTDANSREYGEFTRGVLLLRILSLVFTVIALILLVTDKETEAIPVALPGVNKPIYLTKTASFVDVRALKYYAGSLAVVIAYSFLQGILCIVNLFSLRTVVHSKALAWFTFIADQSVAYFIASAVAVATEVGFLAEHGAERVGWNETCSQFSHFCLVYGISVVNCYLAAVNVFIMAGISAYHLFKQYGPEAFDYGNRKQIDI